MTGMGFFGSILATANHLLWGDWIWVSRFDKGTAPDGYSIHTFPAIPYPSWIDLN